MAASRAEPGTFLIERSAYIAAPAEAIFPHLEDFHRWRAWSPYEARDPDMERGYEGPARGEGAVYTWEGRKAGSGRMQITTARAASEIVIDLRFTKPMKANNTAAFTLAPSEGGTDVTWSMRGTSRSSPG